jgi:hypothetical protein
MAITKINEGSALYFTFTFKDENGAPVIPTSIDWRLDDVTNNVQVLDWAAIGVPAASVNITVEGANNAISAQTNAIEERKVTVRINSGGPDAAYQDKTYKLQNLYGVT